MIDDPLYQYTKLVIENFSIWPFLVVICILWLSRRPELFERIGKVVSKFRIGTWEVEFRELKAKLQETQQQVSELESELEHERAHFDKVIASFNAHAPVSELASTREVLKAMGPGMGDLTLVREGLAPGASAERVYASAEIARSRRDVELFDDLVACLDRLASDENLLGIRLHTVWALTSALHKTLIADIKTGANRLSHQQLETARAMLSRLMKNERVLHDRPDDPSKGVRGPAKWANEWIERRLIELAKST